jgi:hypothetical protein
VLDCASDNGHTGQPTQAWRCCRRLGGGDAAQHRKRGVRRNGVLSAGRRAVLAWRASLFVAAAI